jgi:uncharacterized damage-inducible protein DinB
MTTDDLNTLFAYGRWATRRLLHAVSCLNVSALDQPLETSFGTLRGTILHLYGVERLWLDRWQNGPVGPAAPAWLDSIGDIELHWENVWQGQATFVRSRSVGDLDAVFAYRNRSGGVAEVRTRDMLVHVVNHGTYHRDQIASELRQLGGTPVPTDFLLFTKESQ